MTPWLDFHSHKKSESAKEFSIISSSKIENTYQSLGIHPWSDDYDFTLKREELNSQILFIGECGLDRIKGQDFNKQVELLHKHIKLANEANLGIVFHCVKAYADFQGIIKTCKTPMIFHDYNGSIEQTKFFLKHNCYFSIGSSLFRDNSRVGELLELISIDRLFFETDDSGRSIEDVYKKASLFLNINEAEINSKCIENLNRITASEFQL